MKTAYILGNAPSLLDLPLDWLLKQDSFFVNSSFNLPKICPEKVKSFRPRYYVVADRKAAQRAHDQMVAVQAGAKYAKRNAYNEFKDKRSWICLDFGKTDKLCNGYFGSIWTKLALSRTVVLDCAQIAFDLGYEKVLFGGVELTDEYFYPSKRKPIFIKPEVIKGFEVARDHYAKHGRVLGKISDSPALPLERFSL